MLANVSLELKAKLPKTFRVPSIHDIMKDMCAARSSGGVAVCSPAHVLQRIINQIEAAERETA